MVTPRFSFVLLDADRTLFDFDRAEEQALRRSLAEAGLPGGAEVYQRYHQINQQVWSAYEQGELTKPQLQTARFVRLFAELGVQGDPEAFNERYVWHLGEGAFLLPGALELCQTLAPYCRLDIVTNGVAATQHRRIDPSPLRAYITAMFVSEEAGAQKPTKAYFDYVFAAIPGFEPARAIIVGDSLSSDMQGGVNAGIATCWFNPRGEENERGLSIDFEVRSLSEIVPIVLKG